jgi:hypothetical protein
VARLQIHPHFPSVNSSSSSASPSSLATIRNILQLNTLLSFSTFQLGPWRSNNFQPYIQPFIPYRPSPKQQWLAATVESAPPARPHGHRPLADTQCPPLRPHPRPRLPRTLCSLEKLASRTTHAITMSQSVALPHHLCPVRASKSSTA